MAKKKTPKQKRGGRENPKYTGRRGAVKDKKGK